MSATAALLTALFGNLFLTLAPVPREPTPDPMGRGYVGIRVATGGLTIESVEPGTPGEKAGLHAGDLITRVGTLEPQSFDQVVTHICAFRPGAVVEVEVMRAGQKKAFKVKLTTRPTDLDVNGRIPNAPPVEKD
jgi:S1-C subfamily serine protease